MQHVFVMYHLDKNQNRTILVQIIFSIVQCPWFINVIIWYMNHYHRSLETNLRQFTTVKCVTFQRFNTKWWDWCNPFHLANQCPCLCKQRHSHQGIISRQNEKWVGPQNKMLIADLHCTCKRKHSQRCQQNVSVFTYPHNSQERFHSHSIGCFSHRIVHKYSTGTLRLVQPLV